MKSYQKFDQDARSSIIINEGETVLNTETMRLCEVVSVDGEDLKIHDLETQELVETNKQMIEIDTLLGDENEQS